MRFLWSLFAKFGVLLTSLFVIFVINVKNTSASNTINSGAIPIANGALSLRMANNSSDERYASALLYENGVEFRFSGSDVPGFADKLLLDLGNNYIPDNSIIYLYGCWSPSPSTNDLGFIGLPGGDGFSLVNSALVQMPNNGGVCFAYTYDTSVRLNFLTFNRLQMAWFGSQNDLLVISGISYMHYSDDPDYAQVQAILGYVSSIYSNSNNVDDALSEISQKISDINLDNDRVADAVEEQNQKDNEDRENIEEQSSDAQDSADTASQQITSVSQSLLIVIGNFVNIIINPPARNCVIDADMGHMDLGNIDLCQLTPPEPIQIIATLLIIGFIIPFAYSLIQTFINLLRGATQ